MAGPDGPVVEVRGLWREFPVEGGRRSLLRVLRGAVRGNGGRGAPIRRALQDVSLTASRGDRIAVVGNNAAGKSTLLRIIAGLLRPTRGTVAVRGEMALLTALGLGMIEEVTVLENTYLYGALYGVEPERMRLAIDDILAWAGIAGFEHAKLKTLSAGTRARLAFSVVRHIDADVFLIDEAMSAGDVTFAAKCRAFFEEPANRERTFLVATHDMDLARSFCGSALWLHEGRLMDFGDSRTVVGRYLDAQRPRRPVA
jgi:ABC-type polysaccharide/polyol phosphate transport system ATPase subunit